ncbi:mRNA-decapping enzyme 1A [Coccinella septempunctata]|uniref:mRNA-decapping enzyme 1A n=1 Tax=Coccinella septempunctata TaxID=41139 RepID=UPI001D098B8C|nr:mRNA-decapping enzyme 1A [Coccinella septempunctata]
MMDENEAASLRISFASVKRIDPYVKEILATSSHVALYRFNTNTNEWEKTGVEGALFIYSRNGEPFHSILFMNRLDPNNVIEPIINGFEYQLQTPFLLYKNSSSKIFGIWFFNREDCTSVTSLIELVMENLKEISSEQVNKKENGVDIFSLLTKAQQEFNRTPTRQESTVQPFASTPRLTDVTSKSVQDFFAKASTKTTQKPVDSGHVLQRLMSNPAHSVEHIEKQQQRSVTPQETSQKPFICIEKKGVPIPIPGRSDSHGIPESSLGSSLGILQNNSPLSSQMKSRSMCEDTTDILGTSPYVSFMENTKPLLMTPMMFTTPTSYKDKLEASQASALNQPDPPDGIDLLTEKQLAQALIFLLRNNSDFTRQIHEAYVNSIMEKVKPT